MNAKAAYSVLATVALRNVLTIAENLVLHEALAEMAVQANLGAEERQAMIVIDALREADRRQMEFRGLLTGEGVK